MRLFFYMTALEPVISHFPEQLLSDSVLPFLFRYAPIYVHRVTHFAPSPQQQASIESQHSFEQEGSQTVQHAFRWPPLSSASSCYTHNIPRHATTRDEDHTLLPQGLAGSLLRHPSTLRILRGVLRDHRRHPPSLSPPVHILLREARREDSRAGEAHPSSPTPSTRHTQR